LIKFVFVVKLIKFQPYLSDAFTHQNPLYSNMTEVVINTTSILLMGEGDIWD